MARQVSSVAGRFRFVLALFTLLIVSCSERQEKIDPSLLNYENPLGYNWQLNDEMQAKVRVALEKACEPNPEFSGNDPKVIQYLRKKTCLNSTFQSPIYISGKIFGIEKEGSVSIATKDLSQAVLFEYTYLHNFLIEGEEERQIKRDKLANDLKKELTKVYGAPIKSGYFDEGSETGFVVSEGTALPCSYWQEGSIGIILCSQRVVMVDGTEMSLSFIDLNKVPVGKKIATMVGTLDDVTISKDNIILETPSSNNIGYDSILYSIEDWRSSDKFRSCDEKTTPLYEIINLSPDLLDISRDYTNRLEGEVLADQAIDIINEGEGELSQEQRNQIGLYLLNLAAQQGSASAKNEIAYSLLYCRMNVEQDIQKSKALFDEAAKSGDIHAKVNLAKLHLAQITDATDPLYSAFSNLRDCAESGNEYCAQALIDLDMYINSDYPKPQFEGSQVLE